MPLHVRAHCYGAATPLRLFSLMTAGCEILRLVDASLPRSLSSESEVLALLRDQGVAAQCDDTEGAGWLIGRGWWNAARELVTSSHTQADGKCRAGIEKVVRREVGDMKLKADGLLLALSQQDPDKVGLVRCSFQWAQNSTAIFLTVKFSHRWSSPGALKVHDEKAAVTDCCFNFSASGEHSQLRKRYTLDLRFYREVEPARWSWQHAAAGRITVEIKKKVPDKWPRLLASKDKHYNMAMWDSMHAKWSSDLEKWERHVTETKRKKKKEGETLSKEDIDDADRQTHEDKERLCDHNRENPFHGDYASTTLCEDYWPPAMEGKRGKEKRWLILFYSLHNLGCHKREDKCTETHQKWNMMAKRVADSGKAKVGVLECDRYKELCKKEKVGHTPFVRRYKNGKKKVHYGAWDIDSIMEFLLS